MNLGISQGTPVPITDPVLQQWQAQICAASYEQRPIAIHGAGSKYFYGRLIGGETLDTRDYHGIVAYEPTELVMTARCGTPLQEIDAALAEKGQMLAFEPPHFSGNPTLGGAIAAGLSGPRRMTAGATRDFVLGVQLMNGEGQLLRFGGQVMKNVAGYDVSRLMAGSLGCLGLLTEISLKVVPRPRSEKTLRFALSEREALAKLNQWAGTPLPISASAWHEEQLTLRLSGAEAAVNAAAQKLGGEEVSPEQAATFWGALRDQTHAYFASQSAAESGSALLRLSLPDTAPAIALAAPQLIEWGGAQRWCLLPHATHEDVSRSIQHARGIASSLGGHATLFRYSGGQCAEPVFTPLSAPLLHIHRQLKAVFDPAGIFNHGRMFQDL